jgi:subtilase family serine protease
MFTHPQYNTAGPQETHFRVDLVINNTLNAARSIYPNINCYIVDDQGKRWAVYFVGSPTNLSGEYSGLESREGFVVFRTFNMESSENTFTIEIPTANLPVKVEIPFTYP